MKWENLVVLAEVKEQDWKINTRPREVDGCFQIVIVPRSHYNSTSDYTLESIFTPSQQLGRIKVVSPRDVGSGICEVLK